MPISSLRLIKRCAEYRKKEEIGKIPARIRGIYALYHYRPKLKKYDVVYIGMAGGPRASVRRRLWSHARSEKKAQFWTHFSVFEVWENITEQEIAELEGILRHLFWKDSKANRLARQRSFKKLKKVRQNRLDIW